MRPGTTSLGAQSRRVTLDRGVILCGRPNSPRVRVVVSPAASAYISVLIVSFISLVGLVTLSRDPVVLRRRLPILVSLAAGFLIGGATLHLLPEAIEELGTGLDLPLLFLAGFLSFFLLERYLWFHHHGVVSPLENPDADPHRPGHGLADECAQPHPVVIMNLVGDAAHNLIDGMVIGAAYLIDPATGLATTVAIALHEIPQEIGDFAVLVHGGLTVRRALVLNLASALVAVVGVAVALTVGQRVEGFSAALLPVTAGSFIYIAAVDLIPEIHRHRDRSRAAAQAIALFSGVGMMLLLRLYTH